MSGVLDVRGLTVTIGGTPIVHGVDLHVDAGECVALVGASGSGKTVTARAVLGLSAPGAAVHADVFSVDGVDVGGYTDRRWRRLRGSRVGYVGQEALGALDPLRPVGREVADSLRLHTEMRAAERVNAVRDALAAVGLDPDIANDGRLAGTLSGGMRQRALIAAATVGSPALLVADEPTTALDAGVAVTVMEQLRAAQTRGAGLLVITHDLGLVAGWADRVAVVHEGRIVEQGAVAEVFAAPQHPATRALVRAAGAAAAPAVVRCEVPDAVRGVEARTASGTSHGSEPTSHGARDVLAAQGLSRGYDGVLAVDDVSFGLERGRVLGVIGASGSGKTTLARMLLGLEAPDAGTVTLDDEPWVPLPERERRPRRHRVAAVVQDPGATFDERWNVERVLADAFSRGEERRARGALGERVDAALRQVDLDPVLRSRSPRTLSGGQRQRLAIARALATEPEVIVLDEPVTALDATVQDAVLRLLERLRDETGVAMVFVSHDLRAVRRMADDVLVVHRGAVVEQGPAAEVFARPAHPVTARLLHAAERLAAGPAADLVG
ncbi:MULTISPECIES: ABC transporter ATP-binding protein [Curtobacterium]|uniref:ABC transporter ATP-binding protein n=1 Tax=Curtobacterium TaxID=2034 RepID=UPI00217E7A66|nr:ABC transporter ATP-binding protein [Curtobacterium flaccumfaciens]MCS6563273.1 ABC transporter ATP-binding protein [Curtobacterium flaccumfaciens pv. poinsettiae]UXN30166.1 ABC transporter ATP-binding protein [Curtobacterium flaccumfaciens]